MSRLLAGRDYQIELFYLRLNNKKMTAKKMQWDARWVSLCGFL